MSKVMQWEDYDRILLEAKAMGVDSIGIPGAGEPFIRNNRALVMRFLYRCKDLNMYVTLFSTGEFITPELAKELYELPVEIMIKCNSLDPETQDRFVSDPKRNLYIVDYGTKRNIAIQNLIDCGFNNREACMEKYGRPSRMALVTSIMTSEQGDLSNMGDIAKVLRFSRERNIIFDCDTVLQQGRGASCELCASEAELLAKLQELQKIDTEEFGNIWEPGPGYVDTICDRHAHHLYISVEGEIRPCIGALGVNLGNIKNTTLEQAWNSKEMAAIRNCQFSGPCATCKNLANKKCFGCRGRHCDQKLLNNDTLLTTGLVPTIGCSFYESV
jgi:MoaA/NifB/PqqE/SkfB family radical SAM enzyme